MKITIPEDFRFKECRDLFKNPAVENDKAILEGFIKWVKPDEDAIKEFLIHQKGFSKNKV